MQIGELEDAQAFFQIIITDHPKSPLVKASKAKLKTIQKRLKNEKKKR
jgi:outer membrane protein assembly factor BamD (BamD/ComL family)